MIEDDISLGRIAGIRVGASWTLLVIFWLIAWGLAESVLPDEAPGHAEGSYWLIGGLAAAVFLACLLAHEMAHALTARRAGMRVEGITLWLFGGVSKLASDAPDPRVELRVSVVGPLTSLALAGAFSVVAIGVDATGGSQLWLSALWWLARINLLLGAFNLIPAFPLDGGRILRAFVWQKRGLRRATEVAAAAGLSFGYLLIALGVISTLGGAGLGGIWFVFLGWILLSAARLEQAQSQLRYLLDGVKVGDVMTRDPVVAPADLTVDELLSEYVAHHHCSAFPVIDAAGSLQGLVTLSRIKQLDSEARSRARLRDVALPIDAVPTAKPDEPIIELIARLSPQDGGRALVLDSGKLVGIVTASDIQRQIEIAELTRTDL